MDMLTAISPILIIWLITLISLIDILKSTFPSTNDKLVWVLIVLFLPIIGPILYFYIGQKQKIIDQDKNTWR